MSVLFTKGMIAADFLGDPTGTHRASGGLTAFLFGCRLHGSTKFGGDEALATRVPTVGAHHVGGDCSLVEKYKVGGVKQLPKPAGLAPDR